MYNVGIIDICLDCIQLRLHVISFLQNPLKCCFFSRKYPLWFNETMNVLNINNNKRIYIYIYLFLENIWQNISSLFFCQLSELGSFGKTTGIGSAKCHVNEFLSAEPKVILLVFKLCIFYLSTFRSIDTSQEIFCQSSI